MDYLSIYGGFGNDTIISGNAGYQDINAGGGNDIIFVSKLIYFDKLKVGGGAGNDTADYSSVPAGAVCVNLATEEESVIGGWRVAGSIKNVENAVGTNSDDILIGTQAANLLAGGLGNDSLYGGGGNDTLWGGDGDDVIFQYALPGSSLIEGGAGNDRFVRAHLGSDSIDGSSGFDTADYSALNSADVGISANLATGTFTRQHFVNTQQYGETVRYLAGETETMRSIEAVIGTGNNDFLTGVGVTATPVALYGEGGGQ